MASIFKLQQEYLDMMNEIEDNEGELTPELEEQLAINIDSFEDKMGNYADLIDFLKSQVTMNKDKIEAIVKLSNTSSNLINRLKSNMRDALQLYGEDGKSGNKILNIEGHKFYTRKNELVRVQDEMTFMMQNDYVNSTVSLKIPKKQLDEVLEGISKILDVTSDDIHEDIKWTNAIDKRVLKADLKANVEVDGTMLYRDDNIIIK